MVPAADEFKQKHHGRIRSLSGPAFKSIRVRRSRRVTYCAVAVLIIVLYNLIGISTRWSQPLESPLDTDLEEYPWANYSPILEADPEDQRGQQDFAIRFPDLYATLGRASFAGLRNYNRIVLYAAESLESASKLAGIACEMSTYDRVHVHLALLGQEEFPIDLFQKMNGLSVESGCKVSIHDARPENATEFTQEQMQLSVKAAMKHLYRYLHPQAVLVDMEHEAHWFLKILKQRTKILGITTIELPEHAAENMRWITKLDSGSLKGMNLQIALR